MFFLLSKLLSVLIVPSTIIFGLGLLGTFLMMAGYVPVGRCVLGTSIALIVAVGVLPIGNSLGLPLEERFPHCGATQVAPTGIVVLGGGVIDTEKSVRLGEAAFGPTAKRIVAAADLARRYPSARVVFTGGYSGLISGGTAEADFVVRSFEKLGVPRDRITVEAKSRNTAENAALTKRLVMPRPDEHWLLVTSAMHMPRAFGVFQKEGFAVVACPVDYRTTGTKSQGTFVVKFINDIVKTNLAVHEWLGLLAYRVTGRTSVLLPGKPEPTSGALNPLTRDSSKGSVSLNLFKGTAPS